MNWNFIVQHFFNNQRFFFFLFMVNLSLYSRKIYLCHLTSIQNGKSLTYPILNIPVPDCCGVEGCPNPAPKDGVAAGVGAALKL